jgi:hypothetical protein
VANNYSVSLYGSEKIKLPLKQAYLHLNNENDLVLMLMKKVPNIATLGAQVTTII